MTLRRARTADEYVGWIKQAAFEIQDLRACLEYELEDLTHMPGFLDPLQQSIQDVLNAMQSGRYQFGHEDLPFMDLMPRFADDIPFNVLLKQINATHRHGLEVETNTDL